ncbi:MAG: polyhydroxyalkanoate synthesis repressor PhaR [Steroidobacteraceae bacterium]
MAEERLIKKYANRRLYDASISRHVTLADIRQMIVQGERIRVVEDKTDEDITRLILLQVIAEQEQFGKPILSTTVLESIIRFYGGPMQDFMTRYLESSVGNLAQQHEQFTRQFAQALSSAPPPVANMAALPRQNLEVWTRMQENLMGAFMGTRRTTPAQDSPEPPPEPEAPDSKP